MADPRRIFWLLCFSTLGIYVAQGLLYPGLPLYLTRELGTSKAIAGLIMTSTSLSAIAARPWAGAFIDRRGRRPLILAGPAVIILTTLALLQFHNVWWVLAMRLTQGVGGAMGYSSSAAMAADLAPPAQRTRYLARFGTFFYIGFAVGPWLAEWLIGRSGFSAVWLMVAACAGGGMVIASFLPETAPPKDAAAAGQAPAALALKKRLFHPAAVGPGVVLFCVGVGWTALSAFLALYARQIGMGSSGPLFLTLSITVLCTRALAGSLADRLGKATVLYPSVIAVVAGMALLAAWQRPGAAYLGVVLFGGGFSGLFPVLFAAVVDRAPDGERGAAMGSFNVFFDIGSPIGGYGVGQLIDWGGFGLGFGAMAGLAVVGGLLMPWMLRANAAPQGCGGAVPLATSS